MRYFILILTLVILVSCKKKQKFSPRSFSAVEIENLMTDSTLSIRAIDILHDKSLAFAANNGVFGLYNPKTKSFRANVQKQDSLDLQFRAVSKTVNDFFMLSVESPALLYKTGNEGLMDLVYQESGTNVFYDSMDFWNNEEGIAIGDSIDGCLSIILTRDGGETWIKLPCNNLPKGLENEGAFAASDTNIAIVGDKTWVATTAGRVYYSPYKGKTWEVFNTPIVKGKETEGIYSIDFYDELNGFAIGGDHTNPEENTANKIKTIDGGKTWKLVAQNQNPGYRSCVQYIPGSEGKELVAVGFKGIDFSNDAGESWKHISDESFYTVRFLNDSTAYAAGRERISKLTFR